MGDFFNILASPGEAYEKIKTHPGSVLPTAVCTATLFVIIWLGGCWYNISDALTWSSLFGPALISLLIVGIVSVGSAIFLYLMTMVVGGKTGSARGFRTYFSLNINCAVIVILGEVVNFLLVRANILGEISFALPNRFPVGLDLMLLGAEEPSIYVAIILHATSCFAVWYLVVLAKGLTAITGISRWNSILVVASLWCVTVLIASSLAYAAGGATTIRIRV